MNLTAIVDVEGSSRSIWASKLLEAVTGREDCTSWEVSNKYYEATLEFEVCSLETDMVENYQAVIILHDFYQEESFKRVMSFWGERPVSSAEVLLLVGVEDEGGHHQGERNYEARRTRAIEWCIENGFELVVWQVRQSREEERGGAEQKDSSGLSLLSEEDSDERLGVKRIKEALQAHMWPDMTMKSRQKPAQPAVDPKPKDLLPDTGQGEPSLPDTGQGESPLPDTGPGEPPLPDTGQGESPLPDTGQGESPLPDTGQGEPPLPDTGPGEPSHGSEHSSTDTSALLAGAELNKYTLLPDDLVSSGIIDEACRDEMDESEFESFDRLFSQLPAMKEKAAQLPHSERVEYAEKVVMAFWKCLGTDLEEHGAEDEEELEDDSSKQ